MKLLGKFKDVRGADAGWALDGFDREAAVSALTEMGLIAEKSVLPLQSSRQFPNAAGGKRASFAYNTLGSNIDAVHRRPRFGRHSRRNGAVNWFAMAPVDQKRKADVSRALNKAIPNANFFFDKDLAKVLEIWGTSENVPALTQRLNTNKTGNDEVIRALGKIRDPKGIQAVADSMSNFFNERAAKEVLKEVGAPAEPAVVNAMKAAPDTRARRAYVNLLGEMGTRNVSLPALQMLAFANQNDRFLLNEIANAQKAIIARGK